MDNIYVQIKSFAGNKFNVQITDEQLNQMIDICKVKKHKKGELLIAAGEFGYAPCFLLTGLMRTFYINIDGNEVTNFFIFENTFYGSNFVTSNKPSSCNYEALEDCVSLEFDARKIAELIKAEKSFALLYIAILEETLIEKNERETSLIVKSATERYLDFKRRYPNIETRVNQTHIASYLGITPVSLSRIRRILRMDNADEVF